MEIPIAALLAVFLLFIYCNFSDIINKVSS